VTLGGYYGTNRCKLVGAYILNIITQQHGENFGLYRDYGLGATNKNSLKITIEANKKIINFLDTILNLNNQTYTPYTELYSFTKHIPSKSN